MLRILLSMATSNFRVVDLESGPDRLAKWAPKSSYVGGDSRPFNLFLTVGLTLPFCWVLGAGRCPNISLCISDSSSVTLDSSGKFSSTVCCALSSDSVSTVGGLQLFLLLSE